MRLLLSGTDTTPFVLFDLKAGLLRVEGTSTMVDAAMFYERIVGWLREHLPHIKPGTELVLSLRFLNSASLRAIYRFLQMVAQEKMPVRIVVVHQASSDNTDVVELLEETCRLLGLPYQEREG